MSYDVELDVGEEDLACSVCLPFGIPKLSKILTMMTCNISLARIMTDYFAIWDDANDLRA